MSLTGPDLCMEGVVLESDELAVLRKRTSKPYSRKSEKKRERHHEILSFHQG